MAQPSRPLPRVGTSPPRPPSLRPSALLQSLGPHLLPQAAVGQCTLDVFVHQLRLWGQGVRLALGLRGGRPAPCSPPPRRSRKSGCPACSALSPGTPAAAPTGNAAGSAPSGYAARWAAGNSPALPGDTTGRRCGLTATEGAWTQVPHRAMACGPSTWSLCHGPRHSIAHRHRKELWLRRGPRRGLHWAVVTAVAHRTLDLARPWLGPAPGEARAERDVTQQTPCVTQRGSLDSQRGGGGGWSSRPGLPLALILIPAPTGRPSCASGSCLCLPLPDLGLHVQQPQGLVVDLQQHLLCPDLLFGAQLHQLPDGVVHRHDGFTLVHDKCGQVLGVGSRWSLRAEPALCQEPGPRGCTGGLQRPSTPGGLCCALVDVCGARDMPC